MTAERLILIDAIIFVVVLVIIGVAGRVVWRSFRVKATDNNPYEVRRPWSLHRPSGSLPLGPRLNYDEALAKAAKLGTITFVDLENGFIFCDTHLDTGDAEQKS